MRWQMSKENTGDYDIFVEVILEALRLEICVIFVVWEI